MILVTILVLAGLIALAVGLGFGWAGRQPVARWQFGLSVFLVIAVTVRVIGRMLAGTL